MGGWDIGAAGWPGWPGCDDVTGGGEAGCIAGCLAGALAAVSMGSHPGGQGFLAVRLADLFAGAFFMCV